MLKKKNWRKTPNENKMKKQTSLKNGVHVIMVIGLTSSSPTDFGVWNLHNSQQICLLPTPSYTGSF
jgi:hypothetical protein